MTTHPSGRWAAEIVRRAAAAAKCRYLMRDRDPLYAGLFSDSARSIGLRKMLSAPRTPVMNPYAERVIGTLRIECLDHVIVLGQNHAQRLLAEFADYYNADRPHQSLDGERPAHRLRLVGKGPIVSRPHLRGLHHSYRRAA